MASMLPTYGFSATALSALRRCRVLHYGSCMMVHCLPTCHVLCFAAVRARCDIQGLTACLPLSC